MFRGKNKSGREVRPASLPAVGEEEPGFPLWRRPSLPSPAPLAFIQSAKQLSVTLRDVPVRQPHMYIHTCTHICWNNYTLTGMHAYSSFPTE